MDSPYRLTFPLSSSETSCSSPSTRDSSPDLVYEFHHQVPSDIMNFRQHNAALHTNAQNRQLTLFDRNQQAFQQNLQTQQVYGYTSPRSAVAPNWRTNPARDVGNWTSAAPDNYALTSPTTPRGDTGESKLGGFAYCLDRGNGQFTRLIPADMLPAMVEIPPRQTGPGGMVVLPALQASPPQGVAEMNRPVTIKCSGHGSDNIQKQIDRIVATSPVTPKRPKIYCDKWVHEGTCAFTQQGCKYKHEMPLDKETQHSLGLFQGLPPWYKKLQTELQRHQESPVPVSPTHRVEPLLEGGDSPDGRARVLGQSGWRKENAHVQVQSPTMTMAMRQSPTETHSKRIAAATDALRPLAINGAGSRCVWGPIEPPHKREM